MNSLCCKKNDKTKNEMDISDIIKNKIKNYELYYYVYISVTSLKLEKRKQQSFFYENNIEDVQIPYILINYPKEENYVPINNYLLQITVKQFIMEIVKIYYKLIKILNKLHSVDISYNSILFVKNNVYIHRETKECIIKDFTKSSMKSDSKKDYEEINYIFIQLISSLNELCNNKFPFQLFLKTLFFNKEEEAFYKNNDLIFQLTFIDLKILNQLNTVSF